MKSRFLPAVLATLTLLAACAGPQRLRVPEQLPLPPTAPPAAAQSLGPTSPDNTTLRESATPTRPEPQYPESAGVADDGVPVGLTGSPVSVNVSNLPVPTFVNEVLGDMLGLNFQLDPEVEKLDAMVSLRTSAPQSPANLYRIARQVLADYGIRMQINGDVIRLSMAPAGSRLEPPIVFSGRALPDVPVTHRPVYYLMELQAIRSNEALRWLRAIYGEEVKAEDSSERNALLLSGRPNEVRQAVEALRVFDRPYMRGRASIRLEPAFLSATELASKLTEMLVAEGYGAANSLGSPASLLALPVPAVNSVVIFAGDQDLLRHAVEWAHELDRPNPAAGGQSMFYYPVRNTKAADIARVLGSVNASVAGVA